jgi:hypothetical protein
MKHVTFLYNSCCLKYKHRQGLFPTAAAVCQQTTKFTRTETGNKLTPFPVLNTYNVLAMQTPVVTLDTFTWVFTDTPHELNLSSLFPYLPVCKMAAAAS